MIKFRSPFPDIPANRILVFLNVFAVAFFFLMLNAMGSLGHVSDILFSTPDSQEYYGNAKWLTHASPYCNPNRPFFYPLLILLVTTLAGNPGIWIMHFLFWLAACNLSFLSVRKAGAGKLWAAISFLLVATYLSAICLSAHALTEITVLFILSLLTYVFSSNLSDLRSPSFGFKVIILFSILFAIKPFYQVHLAIAVLVFISFQLRNMIKRPVLVLFLFLSLIPAGIQYTINKSQFGVWNSDRIATINLKFYLMNKVDYAVANDDLDKFNYLGDSVYRIRHDRIDSMSMPEVRDFLFEHPMTTLKVVYDNLKLNISLGNTYIDPEKHPGLFDWELKMNGRFFRIHCLMLIGLFLFFLITIRRKKTPFYFWLLILSFTSFSILLVTGITFWAGDRLVVPSIAIWAVLYPVFVSFLVRRLFLDEGAYFRLKFPAAYKWTK